MRHLHFVQSLEVLQGGGLGAAALALHRTFRCCSEESVLVATCRRDPTTGEPGVREFKRIPPEKAFLAPKALFAASSLAAEAEIIHGHGIYTALNWVFGASARKRDIPLVYHPQGMLEPWILARSRRKKTMAHWLFENANFRHVALWRALTATEAGQIRAFGIKAPIVIAPNGIDVSPFPIPPPPHKNDRRILLFLGRLHPKKGVDILLRAWAAMGAVRGNWELVIAGPDEIGHRALLEEIVAKEHLSDSVRFTGPVTGIEKLALIQSCDLFILPSHSEGFPVAALEAMAACKPVILTPGCNFPDASASGAGWIVEPSVGGIRELLATILTIDRGELRQRGLAGRALVERDYTWSAIARKLIDAIQTHIT